MENAAPLPHVLAIDLVDYYTNIASVKTILDIQDAKYVFDFAEKLLTQLPTQIYNNNVQDGLNYACTVLKQQKVELYRNKIKLKLQDLVTKNVGQNNGMNQKYLDSVMSGDIHPLSIRLQQIINHRLHDFFSCIDYSSSVSKTNFYFNEHNTVSNNSVQGIINEISKFTNNNQAKTEEELRTLINEFENSLIQEGILKADRPYKTDIAEFYKGTTSLFNALNISEKNSEKVVHAHFKYITQNETTIQGVISKIEKLAKLTPETQGTRVVPFGNCFAWADYCENFISQHPLKIEVEREEFERKIKELEERNGVLSLDNARLQQIPYITNRLQNLENQFSSIAESNMVLQDTIDELNKLLTRTEKENKEMVEKNEKLNQELHNIQDVLKRTEEKNTELHLENDHLKLKEAENLKKTEQPKIRISRFKKIERVQPIKTNNLEETKENSFPEKEKTQAPMNTYKNVVAKKDNYNNY